MTSSAILASKIQKLLKKTSDIDKDERFMATSDLCQELAALEEQQQQTTVPHRQTTTPQPTTAGQRTNTQNNISSASLDSTLQLSISRTILTLLEDSSTDVQTVAVKCLSILSRRMNSEQLANIVDKLSSLIADVNKNESRDIYAIGLKTMVAAIANGTNGGGQNNQRGGPNESQLAFVSPAGVTMSHRILTGMITGLKSVATNGVAELEITATILDITKEVLNKFGAHLTEMHEPLLQALTQRLESPHELIRKRTISTLAALVPYLLDAPFHAFMELIINMLATHERQAATITDPKLKQTENGRLYTYLQLLSVVSTHAGARIGKYLNKIVPQLEKFLVLPSSTQSAAEETQLLELLENSLSAFESLLLRCPDEFLPFLTNILKRAEEFVQYDPNYIYSNEDDSNTDMSDVAPNKPTKSTGGGEDDWGEDGTGGDDDWGAGGDEDQATGMDDTEDDSDDTSWKVRRAAVKVIDAFIRSQACSPMAAATSTTNDALAANYSHLCDVLLERFKERNQNVKIILIQTVQDLLRESAALESTTQLDVSQPFHHRSTSSPSAAIAHLDMGAFHYHSGIPNILVQKIPTIVNACIKQLRGSNSSKDDSMVLSSSSSTTAAFAETKHYICLLLLELALVTNGGLDQYLTQLLPLILTNLTSHSSKVELKIDAINLLRACLELHPVPLWVDGTKDIASQLNLLLTSLIQSFNETPYIKYRVAVLETANSLITQLGEFKREQPTRSFSTFQQFVTPTIIQTLYSQLLYSTLQLNDVDQELKDATLMAIGSFFYYFRMELEQVSGGVSHLTACLNIILSQRLMNELTRIASLRCLTRITQSARSDTFNITQFIFNFTVGDRRVLDEMISFIRKDSSVLKYETIQTLIGIVRQIPTQRDPSTSTYNFSLAQLSTLSKELVTHLSDTDLNLANSILTLVNDIYLVFPLMTIYQTTPAAIQDADILLSKLLQFLRSPLLQSQNIATIRQLFRSIMQIQYEKDNVNGNLPINPHLTFKYLFDLFMTHLTQPQPPNQVNLTLNTTYLTNVSEVVGSGLLRYIPASDLSAILQQLLQMVQAGGVGLEGLKQFALLLLGEIGRSIDLTKVNSNLHPGIFFHCFTHESESIRFASSIAFGHIMMGNISQYLPILLKQLEEVEKSNATSPAPAKDMLMLLLTSLKELISNIIHEATQTASVVFNSNNTTANSHASVIRSFFPALLPLLWSHAEHAEEIIRSLVSEILGGLLIIDGASIFPEMVRLAANSQPFTRALVITALRHAITVQQQITNENNATAAIINHTDAVPSMRLDPQLLHTHLPRFLQLLRDSDLIVRRQAILTVNALAHAKTYVHQLFSSDFQTTLLPIIYQHLIQDQSLVRIVDLGPFKHKIDDGFPLRKAAYQTLDTFLEVGFPSLDVVRLLNEISQGLNDHDDIMILVYQMLEKCAQKYPNQLTAVLDELPPKMMDGVKEKLKLAKTVAADPNQPPPNAAAPSAPGGPSTLGDASTAERAKDVLRAAVRCFIAVQGMPTLKNCPQFIEFYQRVLKTAMLARMMEEIKQQN